MRTPEIPFETLLTRHPQQIRELLSLIKNSDYPVGGKLVSTFPPSKFTFYYTYCKIVRNNREEIAGVGITALPKKGKREFNVSLNGVIPNEIKINKGKHSKILNSQRYKNPKSRLQTISVNADELIIGRKTRQKFPSEFDYIPE